MFWQDSNQLLISSTLEPWMKAITHGKPATYNVQMSHQLSQRKRTIPTDQSRFRMLIICRKEEKPDQTKAPTKDAI